MIDYYGTTRVRTRETPSLPSQSHEFLIRAKYPGPGGKVVSRYKSQDIEICPSEAICTQYMADQVSARFSELVSQKRQITQQIKILRARLKTEKSALRKKIVDSHEFRKVRWTWISVPIWRPARYKRVFIGNGSKKVKVGERTIYRLRYDSVTRTMVLRPVRRSLFKTITYPLYRRVLAKPAGLEDSRRRDRKIVRTLHYWDRIAADWNRLKAPLEAKYDNLIVPLIAARQQLRKQLSVVTQNDRPLVAYRDGGRIAALDPSRHSFAVERPALDPWDRYGITTLRGWYDSRFSGWNYVISVCPTLVGRIPKFAIKPSIWAFDTQEAAKSFIDDQTQRSVDAELAGSWFKTAPRRAVDHVRFLDVSSDMEDIRREEASASAVKALDGAQNYAFNLIRSIGELKDVPQTVRQGADFLRFLSKIANPKDGFTGLVGSAVRKWTNALNSVACGVAAGYLAWKFAIQPTYQDIQTVMTHSSKWVMSLNRFLDDVVQQLSKTQSSVYHMRSKFRGLEVEDLPDLKITRTRDVDGQRSVDIAAIETIRVGHQHPSVFYGGAGVADISYDIVPGLGDALVPAFRKVSTFGPSGSWGRGEPLFGGPQYREQAFTFEPSFRRTPVSVSPSTVLTSVWPSQPNEYTQMGGDTAEYDSEERKALQQAIDDVPITDPLYCLNHVSGVAFAKFATGDLLEYAEQLSGSFALADFVASLRELSAIAKQAVNWTGYFQESIRSRKASIGSSVSSYLKGVDYVYILWQLYPLSFVADWVLTSDRSIKMVNRMLKSILLPPPDPLEPLGMTKRVELLAGMRMPTLVGQRVTCQIKRMAICRLNAEFYPDHAAHWGQPASLHQYLVTPSVYEVAHRLRFSLPKRVQLQRSGIYTAARGRFESTGWTAILPSIRLRLDTSKLATLFSMYRSMIG